MKLLQKRVLLASIMMVNTVAGAELVTNGDFSSALTGPWTTFTSVGNGTNVIESGKLKITGIKNSTEGVTQSLSLVKGETYDISFNISSTEEFVLYDIITANNNKMYWKSQTYREVQNDFILS